jgi:hypothetical protein
MANFDTYYTNPVSTDWLFPATSGSYTFLTSTTSYFDILTAGHGVRYARTCTTANGGGPAGNVTSADFVLQGGG